MVQFERLKHNNLGQVVDVIIEVAHLENHPLYHSKSICSKQIKQIDKEKRVT